jgi:putative hydrolase of the HAD superfamily
VQFEKLENAGLSPFFDVIVCSEHIGFNKPHPNIFNHAMNEAKTKGCNSLMVGDDYRADISGAINAGMHALWFEPNLKNGLKFENRITDLNEIPQKAAQLLSA